MPTDPSAATITLIIIIIIIIITTLTAIITRIIVDRDNNMKYVSLSLMQTTLSEDPQALNRHRNVILECVKDSDDSIRRKALDLVMILSNKDNAKDIIKELIAELRVCDRSFKSELGDRICVLVQKARADLTAAEGEERSLVTKWYIDSMLVVLTLAGTVAEDACRALMMVVLNSEGYTAYACDTYFETWESGKYQSPSLTQVTLWMCGEFALRKKSDADDEITLGDFDSPIDETKLLGMIDRILVGANDDGAGVDEDRQKIKAYALTTLAKLYPRCTIAHNKELIRKMLRTLDADVDVEIQTRSVECVIAIMLTGRELNGERSDPFTPQEHPAGGRAGGWASWWVGERSEPTSLLIPHSSPASCSPRTSRP